MPLLGFAFVNTRHLFLLLATYTISYAEPNFKIPLPHFYFTFTSRTAIYGLDGVSIVNSPLWRPAGVMVMFQVSMISDEDILKLKDLPIWFTHAKPTRLSFRMTLSFRPMNVWQRSTRMHTLPTGTRYSITPEHRKMQTAPHSNTSATGPGSRC